MLIDVRALLFLVLFLAGCPQFTRGGEPREAAPEAEEAEARDEQ
jgi:hypothetical protein